MHGFEFQEVSHHLKSMKIRIALLLTLFSTSVAFPQTLKFKLTQENGSYVGTMKPGWFKKVTIFADSPDIEGAKGKMEGGKFGVMQFGIAPNTLGTGDTWMLKTTNGWYPMQDVVFKGKKLTYTFPWDFQAPYTAHDLEILKKTDALLSAETWQKEDDRDCDVDFQENKYSLYCALKKASLDVTGDFNHRSGAMNIVREDIVLLNPLKEYEHRLMDFNNENSLTTIKELLFICQRKLEEQITND